MRSRTSDVIAFVCGSGRRPCLPVLRVGKQGRLPLRAGACALMVAAGMSAATTTVFVPPMQLLPGFKVEPIYIVPTDEQGSWICVTDDPKGRLIAADQYGGLYRVTVPPIGTQGSARVEKLLTKLTGAHGLLCAFDSLYVMINEERANAGIWQLRDTDGDGEYDEEKK